MYKALYLAILIVLTSSMFFSKTNKPLKKEHSKKLLSESYNSSTSSTCTMCK